MTLLHIEAIGLELNDQSTDKKILGQVLPNAVKMKNG